MTSHRDKTHQWVVLLSGVLIALLALIGTLSYTDNKQLAAPQFTLDAIQTLRIQRPDFAEIQLNRIDDQWLIREPCKLTANSLRLEPLLGALMPAAHSYAAKDVDLDAAGLIEPLATVFLNDTRIDIGEKDLDGNRRYIRRDNRIEFAPEWILSLINGGLSAMANLQVFDADISAIQILNEYGEGFDVPTELVADWQSLSAQQIVSWPLQPEELALIIHSLEIKQGDTERFVKVYTYSQFSALHRENEQCAFILSTESLPDTFSP